MAMLVAPLLTAAGVSAGTAATIGTGISIASTGLSLLGAVSDYRSAQAQAKAVGQQAQYRARTAEIAAGQERAQAQRAAEEERRQGRLALSRAIAVGASSGGSATDPTVVDIAGDIAGEGEYRALSRLYSGEERARGLQSEADLTRYSGALESKAIKRAAKSSLLKDVGSTLLTAGKSAGSKYGAPFQSSQQLGSVGGSTYSSNLGWIDWTR